MGEREEPRATWFGHSTVLIEQEGARILTDPVLRDRILHLRRHPEMRVGLEPGRLDAVLLSHHHFDHFDRPSLRSLDRETTVIGGPGTRALLRREGFSRVIDLAPGERVELERIGIRATPAEHDGSRTPFHQEGEAVGFVVEGPRSVYFAGDTDLFDELGEVARGSALALLPVWGWGSSIGPGHLDPERAAEAVSLIAPDVAVPIHWGTFAPMGLQSRLAGGRQRPAELFARFVSESTPQTDVRILRPGGSTTYS